MSISIMYLYIVISDYIKNLYNNDNWIRTKEHEQVALNKKSNFLSVLNLVIIDFHYLGHNQTYINKKLINISDFIFYVGVVFLL